MKNEQPQVQDTLLILLAILFSVIFIANISISNNSAYYSDPNIPHYEKWVSLDNIE